MVGDKVRGKYLMIYPITYFVQSLERHGLLSSGGKRGIVIKFFSEVQSAENF